MDLDVCRICGGIEDLKHISENDPEMIEKLSKCANIHLDPTDALPKLICGQCNNNLEISYQLRKQSEETQRLLEQKLEMKKSQQFNKKREALTVSLQIAEKTKAEEELKESIKTSDNENKIKKSGEDVIMSAIFIVKAPEILIEDNILSEQNFESNTEDLNNITDALIIDDDESKDDTKRSERSTMEECTIDLLSSPSVSEINDDTNDEIECEPKAICLYTCDTCQNGFSSKKEYIRHIREHGRERYQCIQCCKFFPTQYRLKRHEDVHNDYIIYKCPHCERTYRGQQNLRRHIRSVHLNGMSVHCEVCNISFSRKDVLKRHMLLHSDKRNYNCQLCPQSFKTKDYLSAHCKNRHEKEVNGCKKNKKIMQNENKRYQCGYCGKIFKSSFPYKNHILIHTNEKPHECETCEKKFRTIAALTTHQRIHDDYRPYQCDVCLKSFKQTWHLKEHKALHLENVPQYTCSVCQSSFVKKSNLKAHMQLHATEKPFKCAECTAEFTYVHLLQKHANKVHNRTISKEYDISDTVDLAEPVENSEINDETFKDDVFHFISTIPEESDIEENFCDNEEFSADLEKRSENNIEKLQISNDENNANFIDCIYIDSSNSVQSLPTNESFCREEVHITENKIEVFVNEETKITSTSYDLMDIINK